MVKPVTQRKGGLLIAVRVTPDSDRDDLVFADGRIRLKLREPAEDDRANKAVLAMFNRKFGKTTILRGLKTRKKTLYVEGLSEGEFNEKIREN